ncbi:MAG: hypothetical protein BalsKO_09990 [Balneolaceae bacterium]
MKNLSFLHSLKTLSIITLSALIFVSCDNSTGSEEEEHSEPAGFRLKMNGSVVVEQLPGETITGEFELEPEQETPLITIFFLAEDGDEFQPDEPEYSLNATFDTDGIAEFEQHEEDGTWSFHIHAEAEGITNMTLQLFHNDHSDFNTQDIHVHVEAATAAKQ